MQKLSITAAEFTGMHVQGCFCLVTIGVLAALLCGHSAADAVLASGTSEHA